MYKNNNDKNATKHEQMKRHNKRGIKIANTRHKTHTLTLELTSAAWSQINHPGSIVTDHCDLIGLSQIN